MTSITRHVAVGACLCIVVLASSCKTSKDKAKSGGGAAGPPASVVGLAAVPASARVVVGADVKRLAESELVVRAVEQMFLRDPGLRARIDELMTACKVNPAEHVRSFVIGMGEGDDVVLVATGSFEEAKIAVCVDKSMAKGGGRVTTRTADGRTLYRAESGPDKGEVWFAFGSETTLIISSTESWLKSALSDAPKANSESGLAELILLARPGDAAMWAVGAVPPAVGAGLVKTSGGKLSAPNRMFGHLDLRDGLRAELGAVMADEAAAKLLITYAEPQMRLLALAANARHLGRFVSALTLSHEGNTAYLRVSLTHEDLRDLVSRIDNPRVGEQNPALDAGQQGAVDDAHRDAASGG